LVLRKAGGRFWGKDEGDLRETGLAQGGGSQVRGLHLSREALMIDVVFGASSIASSKQQP
jgi:hypothetical protein